uniref:Uncharacterized protein n=1 Tax=Amphimedon queenslandica TaxID=400682 RepID=A0A1X7UET8_AMPQE
MEHNFTRGQIVPRKSAPNDVINHVTIFNPLLKTITIYNYS